MKMFGTIFFACVMFFFVWVVLAGTPIERLDRGCTPVNWAGKAVTSLAALGSAKAESRASATTQKLFFTCRYFWFRQFYADEYAALVARQQPDRADKAAPAAKAAPATPGPDAGAEAPR